NALAHPDGIKRLRVGQLQSPVTVPSSRKRKLLSDGMCRNCTPISIPHLDSVFAFSPYSKVLRTRTFVELSEEICSVLNEDWIFQPQYRYGCAQILAGCILINTTNGNAILANTVEMYGRTIMVDAHCEPFRVRKGVAIPTSIPKPGAGHYKDVRPSTMFSTEGERLVIGTHSFDALITSCVRLDEGGQGSVGASTGIFQLVEENDIKGTRIYLDKESLDLGLDLCRDRRAYRITNAHFHYQLRQLKTKFHDPSSYLLCRATGPLTKAHTLQPCTIFMVCNHTQTGDGHQASKLFHKIGMSVLQSGGDATLEFATVQECIERCTSNSKGISAVLRSIGELFDDAPSILILGNTELNRNLE
ncbi:hypothetical protein BGW41_007065, partial [Actinomortierella wolfii]